MSSHVVTEDRVRGLIKLSTMQGMKLKLHAAIQNELCSIDEIAYIIRHDQVMAARIVSVANSSAFGYRGKIESIEEAILLLGMDLVKNISIGVAMFTLLPLPDDHLEKLWAHSYMVAVLSEAISRKRGAAGNSSAFLAGLLHDIGRLAIMMISREEYIDHILLKQTLTGKGLLAVEKEIFGCDHQIAGAWFLESLCFPANIIESCRYHHDTQAIGVSSDEYASVCIADGLTGSSETFLRGDGEWGETHLALFEKAGCTAEDHKQFIALIYANQADICNFFSI